jgi:hypothetical protein
VTFLWDLGIDLDTNVITSFSLEGRRPIFALFSLDQRRLGREFTAVAPIPAEPGAAVLQASLNEAA